MWSSATYIIPLKNWIEIFVYHIFPHVFILFLWKEALGIFQIKEKLMGMKHVNTLYDSVK